MQKCVSKFLTLLSCSYCNRNQIGAAETGSLCCNGVPTGLVCLLSSRSVRILYHNLWSELYAEAFLYLMQILVNKV